MKRQQTRKKRFTHTLPDAITSPKAVAMFQERQEKIEAEKKEKEKRKKEREEKRKQKEELAKIKREKGKGKATKQKQKTDSSDDEMVAETICGKCRKELVGGTEYGCEKCPRWYHPECLPPDLISLTREEMEDMPFECDFCLQ